MKKLKIIVAMDKNGVIGHGDKIPWILADDYKQNFVPKTTGCPVIMGRKTAETLPSSLKNRTNIVVSSKGYLQINGKFKFFLTNNIWDALFVVANESNGDTMWCIGGAQIYKEFEKKFTIDEYHITYVDGEFESPSGVEEIIFNPNLDSYKIISETSFKKRPPNPELKDRGNSHDFKVVVYSL